MNKGMGIFAGIIGVILVLAIMIGGYFISTGNSIVNKYEEVNLQKSQIEVSLQKRADLIPNLVATVKGYATHEEKVFTEIAEARSKLAGSIQSGDVNQMSEANSNLSSALSRLLVITENYPELKADTQFIQLQNQLTSCENEISNARSKYNDSVKTFNAMIKRFPTSIVANMRGYSDFDYFKADEGSQKAPVVDFGA
jgi:LemA protein